MKAATTLLCQIETSLCGHGVQCVPDVRKKPHFTHDRGNLRGDVSGKRFNAHVAEVNMADVA